MMDSRIVRFTAADTALSCCVVGNGRPFAMLLSGECKGTST